MSGKILFWVSAAIISLFLVGFFVYKTAILDWSETANGVPKTQAVYTDSADCEIATNPVSILTPKDLNLPSGFANENMDGATVIKVPNWVKNPLGKFYMYFADHKGLYIRLAFTDDLLGEWEIYEPGVLSLNDSPLLSNHVASPEIFIDDSQKKMFLIVHGHAKTFGDQRSILLESKDGIRFIQDSLYKNTEFAHYAYIRAFEYEGEVYLVNSRQSGYLEFDKATKITGRFKTAVRIKLSDDANLRHASVYVDGNTLHVYYTRRGDAPERIIHSTVDMSISVKEWSLSGNECVRKPILDWEGASEPITASEDGRAPGFVNQLRDPYIFVNGTERYIFYSYGGESGIAVAKLP